MVLPIVFVLNLAATWYMTGLIWFIQLVHYAQFPLVGVDRFQAYHRRHTRFTTFAVGPAMVIEATSAMWLVVQPSLLVPLWAGCVGIGLVALIWLSTAALQIPRHNRLAKDFDSAACDALNRTNWLRTFAWTGRGVLLGWLAVAALVRSS